MCNYINPLSYYIHIYIYIIIPVSVNDVRNLRIPPWLVNWCPGPRCLRFRCLSEGIGPGVGCLRGFLWLLNAGGFPQ